MRKWVLVDSAPSTSKMMAKELSGDVNWNILQKDTGPFIVKKVGSQNLKIEENDVENTITADRETLCETKPASNSSSNIVLHDFVKKLGDQDEETSLNKPHATIKRKILEGHTRSAHRKILWTE